MIYSLILALTTVLGDGVTTNIVIESDVKESRGYSRQLLMEDDKTNLVDRSGVVVDTATQIAFDVAADGIVRISEAAEAGTETALRDLYSAQSNTAHHAKSYQLYFPPETTRSNLTFYVAKEETDMTNDWQWVWCNFRCTMKPLMFVSYCDIAQTQDVQRVWLKADGTNGWEPDGVSVTDELGQTWNGCHKCKLERPSWAVGKPCVTRRNDRIGEHGGLQLGDANMTLDGEELVTGVFTNYINGAVEFYDCGRLTGIIHYE